ncbi:hypothetical protein KW429_11390 [Vibrio fluvialis]|nr:hypothetical protein [Vibrio fluvialis]
MNSSSKDGIVDALILKIERKQQELSTLRHISSSLIEELSQREHFIAIDNAVISIHTFIQSYLATASLYPTGKITVHRLYATASSKQYCLNMLHDANKGDNHEWNLSFFIGLYMKEALQQGGRDWQNLIRRLRNIVASLQTEASRTNIDLRHIVNQEMIRHLSSLEYYYEKLVDHKQPDLEAHKELYEIYYQWNDLCWRYSLVKGPFNQHHLYEVPDILD